MNETLKREILLQVADGTLTPEQAAERLEALGEPEATPSRAEDPGARPAARIKVIGSFRTATIIGDPDVREAVAEGPHTARREGDTFVIEGDPLDLDGSGFSFSQSRRPRVTIGVGSRPRPLTVRVNPALPLEVVLDAGKLTVRDVRGPIRAEVSAGAAKIDGFASPIDVTVAAGKVEATGVLDHGDSRVRCEAGTVKIHLRRGSSVRLTTKVGLGKVVVPHGALATDRGFLIGAAARETTVGEGRGTLEVEASLGTVEVTTEG